MEDVLPRASQTSGIYEKVLPLHMDWNEVTNTQICIYIHMNHKKLEHLIIVNRGSNKYVAHSSFQDYNFSITSCNAFAFSDL